MSEMITQEQHGDDFVVTILDDAGRDADLEIHFKENGPNITLRQSDDNGGDVIVLTPMQATLLTTVLEHIIVDDDEVLH